MIKSLASGKHDDSLSDRLVDAVITRLDVVLHTYHQATFSERAILVAMYQSIALLEQAGYTVQPKDKGRLTPWINGVVAASRHIAGLPRQNEPLYRLLYKSGQQTFWEKHLFELLTLFGIASSEKSTT